jgi:hypothetical protein
VTAQSRRGDLPIFELEPGIIASSKGTRIRFVAEGGALLLINDASLG